MAIPDKENTFWAETSERYGAYGANDKFDKYAK